MPNANQNIKYYELAEKWLNATITPEEEKIFFNWYNQGQEAPLTIPENFAKDNNALKQKIWLTIEKKRNVPNQSIAVLRYITFKRVAAAIIFLLIGSATFYLFGLKKTNTLAAENVIEKQNNNSILPGGNKAILTLADGKIITLDDASNGKITHQGNANIIKLKSGLLAYEQIDKANIANTPATINVLSTPRGGQYQVELPDGSKVWLNASSSLTYPTFFSGKERVVELSGEAYFEVAKNKDMPFKVKVNSMEVSVLGTHFNVMAYSDENVIKTTLLEGSVKVIASNISKLIVPGQQTQLTTNGKLTVSDADVDEAVAWKNGFFQFNSADMQTVIRQINRWYDVDVVYAGNIDEHFTGTISRSVEASQVLKKLQLTGAFKFEVKNKKVFITK